MSLISAAVGGLAWTASEYAIHRFIGHGPKRALKASLLEKLTHGEFCVGELADSSGEALSTVSQRLRRLRGDALVRRRRDGKHIYYTVADEHVAELIRTALDHALHEHEPSVAGEDAGEEEDEG